MSMHGLVQFALSQVWAMKPDEHRRMIEILVRHADGVKLTEQELVAATGRTMPGRAAEMEVDEKTGIATIPIHGVIAHRAGAVGRISSRVGTSVEHIRADLREAMSRDSVKGIVLDVDSPGGSVGGITELAEEIRAARELKPIIAHTDSLMASAAYWLGAQANQVFATRTAEVGSIGVIASFFDGHRAAANQGFDPIVIKSTPAKGGMQGNGSVSDSERVDIQRAVDHFHGLFLEAVAAGRRVDEAAAKALGDGRVYIGPEAQQRGFIDGISSRASAVKHLRGLMRDRAAAARADQESSRELAADTSTTTAEAEHMDEQDKKVPAPAGGSDSTKTNAAETWRPESEAKLTAMLDEARALGAAHELVRCSRIVATAADVQRELRDKLLADRTPLVEALEALAADSRDRLAAAKAPTPTPSLAAGNSATVAGTPKAAEEARIKAMPEGEEKWKAEFAASPDLQAEFDSFDLYRGWKRNEQALAARSAD